MTKPGFVLNGKHYDFAAITHLSILDAIEFDGESRRKGWGLAWADLLALSRDVTHADDVASHPGAYLLLGATVWASRKAAGEAVTFGEAVDFPLDQVQWVNPPRDHQVATPDPHRTRPASGAAGSKGKRKGRR